jgi:hypothetical protein
MGVIAPAFYAKIHDRAVEEARAALGNEAFDRHVSEAAAITPEDVNDVISARLSTPIVTEMITSGNGQPALTRAPGTLQRPPLPPAPQPDRSPHRRRWRLRRGSSAGILPPLPLAAPDEFV